MSAPREFACHILPLAYKEKGEESISATIKYLTEHGFNEGQVGQLETARGWATSKNTWEEQKETFINEVTRTDLIRGEDFRKTFPELAPLLDM